MRWVLLAVVIAATIGLSLAARRATARRSSSVIDPFTIDEPWRRLVAAAQRSGERLHETVAEASEGPLKDRMTGILTRFDEGLAETWRIARRGHQIDATIRRLDPTALQAKLDILVERQGAGSQVEVTAAVESTQRQLESVERLRTQSRRTADRLRVSESRLEELVSRAAEVVIGAGDTDRYEHDVDDLVIELEALRQAVEETKPL